MVLTFLPLSCETNISYFGDKEGGLADVIDRTYMKGERRQVFGGLGGSRCVMCRVIAAYTVW